MTRTLIAATSLAAAFALPALALTAEEEARIDASSTPAAGEPTLAEMRAGAARFADVNVALAEGYIPDPSGMCETGDMMGAGQEGGMGVHYFRPDLLGISAPPNPRVDGSGTYTDFAAPAVLLYEPQADGSVVLVGVENLVFRKAWQDAGNTAAPSLHGISWEEMADDPVTTLDEAHGFEPHFDKHVWLFRENPNGVFAPFNPNVSCEHGAHGAHAHN